MLLKAAFVDHHSAPLGMCFSLINFHAVQRASTIGRYILAGVWSCPTTRHVGYL
jgi:hypothetical protein